jgi:hypothetical protein
MPRARKEPPQINPDTVYVAWTSGAAQLADGTEAIVKEGNRYRGDNPLVKALWWMFLPDGHTGADRQARYRELYPEPEPHVDPYRREKPAPPLGDEDAMVCIAAIPGGLTVRGQGVAPGTKVPKDHPDVKRYPEHFAPVVPEGLSRENAVVSKHTIRIGDTVVVHQGQWLPADHYEARRHPERFELPGLEGTTLERSQHTPKVKE